METRFDNSRSRFPMQEDYSNSSENIPLLLEEKNHNGMLINDREFWKGLMK